MKKFRNSIVVLLLVSLLFSCAKESDFTLTGFNDDNEKGIYSYGLLQSLNDKDANINIDGAYFARGVYDGFSNTLMFDYENANRILEQYDLEYMQKGKSGKVGKEFKSIYDVMGLKEPKDLHQQFSYLWGFLNTPLVESERDIKVFLSGYYDGLYDRKALLSDENANVAFNTWSQKLLQEMQERGQRLLEENLKKAEDFLLSNKDKDGVVVIEDGLQIKTNKVVESGDRPNDEDSVIVDYKLTLLDGTIADQGNDVTFSLQSLIPGFSKAVVNMRVGESITAYIHPDLGYGARDMGNIGPNSLLIFDITLKDIK